MSTTDERYATLDQTTRIAFEIRDRAAAERMSRIQSQRAARLNRDLGLLPDGYPAGPGERTGRKSQKRVLKRGR